LFKEFRDAVLVQLAQPLSLTELAQQYARLEQRLTKKRPRRPRQLQRLRQIVRGN
jgi:hypothetical protein